MVTLAATDTRSSVLLATCKAVIVSPDQTTTLVRLLIDTGSELTLVSTNIVKRAKLYCQAAEIPIMGVGNQRSNTTSGQTRLLLQSCNSNKQVCIRAYALPQITTRIPSVAIPDQHWPHLSTLEQADPDFLQPGNIDVLIGADTLNCILEPSQIIKGHLDEPIAIHTVFGWAFLGPASSQLSDQALRFLHVVTNDQLQDSLTRFWVQEEVPEPAKPSWSLLDTQCEDHYVSTHSRNSEGRYVVRIPLSSDVSQLGDSRHTAYRCLLRLLKRLDSNELLKQRYFDFMQEYETLGHMVSVPKDDPEPQHVYYLPHHGVLREQSTSTKLRVVFNGSYKTTTQVSLNDIQYTGPKTQRDIIDVLLWIRRHKYIFMTDIVKMFRQVEVHPDDWDLQRILWVNKQLDVQAYQLKTITYGTRSAPYLACRTLIKLVEDERENYPLAVDSILKGSYVDDISGGADSIEHLNLIAQQLNSMCASACLPLDKWKSNSQEFIIPSASQLIDKSTVHTFDESLSKVLGISWSSSQDAFTFQGSISERGVITKRAILSEVAQLFDPLGLISPVVIRAKILLQQLWLEKLSWDEPLCPDTINQWTKFREDISKLTELQVPRWVQLQSDSYSVQLHGFSDASQLAMAAVVYLRVTDQEGSSKITLVCSNTKVAPIKRLTIPRLELSAAVLLSHLMRHIQSPLDLQDIPVFLWTDSSITLAWVKNNPMKWKEYVGNRVASIHQALPNANWRYTSGKLNPADCASRGLDAHQLINHPLWWSGPPWLAKSPEHWPTSIAPSPTEDLEERPGISLAAIIQPTVWDLIDLPRVDTFHKDLQKLLRITALCQRAISCFRRTPNSSVSISPISPADLEKARISWIKTTQQAYFSSEISTIKSGKQLPKSHALSRLTARLDHQGLLRVGSRLQNSLLDEESKHPLILPRQCKLSELLIADAHTRTLHGGTQLTLTYLRRQCWILRGRAPIKSFIQRCLVCARIRAVRTQQRIAPLPASRVTPSLVFETTGVDYAGSITLKTFQGRGTKTFKGWIAVFVCFSTSAIHLELVSDYSTEGFLKAFRRFTSRRGLCKTLHSDCGTNFKGADKELQRLFSKATQSSKDMHRLLANDGVDWKFNPPGAPHMGGK
ncbi:uncharacterized protein LOC123266046 [Cotesia glomerata]|uniref:uncharacterized protein LOC123266046 n=1 Tax=Cotesia glomerata TaxID=32391 RepID=UPI001D00438E|nr:uncharacterized protein LOC123266046 [Cotesia glomerata]